MLPSQVADIYYPIGFATAFIIRAKIGIQELWQIGLDWDDKSPSNIQEKWFQLFKKMQEFGKIGQRWLLQADLQNCHHCVFSDTSQGAFSAYAYNCQKTKQDTH